MSYTSLIFSTIERTTNTILAPVKVIKDKVYDVLTCDDKKTKDIQRMYPKSTITEYISFVSNPTEVYPRLFLGSACNAASFHTLVDLKIKYIINVSVEISNYYPKYFTYYQIPIRDDNTESIRQYFTSSAEKIDSFLSNNDGNILIHCYMGASRSATIMANYISIKTNDDITTILDNLKQQRPVVNLTQQFVSDLRAEKL